ncbi:MAG: A/G-specific adenine glycosylase [Fimbriimonadaceae bacterium]|nr:A/G-specific adenine glycosylase [Chitinophagales bacterium]
MLGQKFNTILNNWYIQNARLLPWKGEKNPYYIWLSEIILQQTRVEQGVLYYHKFRKKFPLLKQLANAHEDEILKMWEGLGYYTRARNLHATAKIIAEQYNGKFPDTYEKIIQLKGIGDYTAAAIASFAYDLPYAVVDANVLRILARIFGVYAAINTNEAKKKIAVLANKLLDKNNPAAHNQAMMDFGATVCKPVNPMCENCPFKNHCYAYKNNVVELLPVKSKKIKRRVRYFHYFIIKQKNSFIIEKRTTKDIWKNMYQFPMLEEKRMLSSKNILMSSAYKEYFTAEKIGIIKESAIFSQQLTHQTIKAKFFIVMSESLKRPLRPGWIIPEKNKFREFAFPGIIRNYLEEMQ